MKNLSSAPIRTPPIEKGSIFHRVWQSWFSELRDKILTIETDSGTSTETVQENLDEHIAAHGTAVHGLGTASTHTENDFEPAGAIDEHIDAHVLSLHDGILRLISKDDAPAVNTSYDQIYKLTANPEQIFIKMKTGAIYEIPLGKAE
jgi:hypothetical protein